MIGSESLKERTNRCISSKLSYDDFAMIFRHVVHYPSTRAAESACDPCMIVSVALELTDKSIKLSACSGRHCVCLRLLISLSLLLVNSCSWWVCFSVLFHNNEQSSRKADCLADCFVPRWRLS